MWILPTISKCMDLPRFFIVVQPGLEDLSIRELTYWWPLLSNSPLPELKLSRGGFEMVCEISDGFKLNYVLKIPTRILLRIAEFRCRDFPSLYNKIQKIPWRQFVDKGNIHWEISSSRSRLAIEKRIADTCAAAYESYHQGHEPKANSSHHNIYVHVRFVDDLCTLSVDTGGESLYKRGYRTHIGEAPIRENLAAALLWKLLEGREPSQIRDVCLADPMMGSGTFLIEGFHLFHPNRFRPFAFEFFSMTPQSLRKAELALPTLDSFAKYFGRDMDADTVEAARTNFRSAKMSADISVSDLFAVEELPNENRGTWVVCNPPYGTRLPLKQDAKNYFKNLAAAIESRFKPQRVGLLIPRPRPARLDIPWILTGELEFENGGIPVSFLTFEATGQ